MTSQGPPSGGLFVAVPDLTRSADIKLNSRVSLRRDPHRIRSIQRIGVVLSGATKRISACHSTVKLRAIVEDLLVLSMILLILPLTGAERIGTISVLPVSPEAARCDAF